MAEQKAAARAAWKGSGAKASDEIWFDIAENGATEFTGYANDTGEAQVVAIVKDGASVRSAVAGDTVEIVVNQTPFYAESGGQVGDGGTVVGDGRRDQPYGSRANEGTRDQPVEQNRARKQRHEAQVPPRVEHEGQQDEEQQAPARRDPRDQPVQQEGCGEEGEQEDVRVE